MRLSAIYSNRIARFMVVGLCNAAISFGILNLSFYTLHRNKVVSSIISTTCAVLFSFAMNRIFVFSDKTKRIYKQLLPFSLVTVSGSLLVLNAVYILSLKLLSTHEQPIVRLVQTITGVHLSGNFLDINLSTVIGALVAMVWNYNGYKWFVFEGSKAEGTTNEAEAIAETI